MGLNSGRQGGHTQKVQVGALDLREVVEIEAMMVLFIMEKLACDAFLVMCARSQSSPGPGLPVMAPSNPS